MILSLIILVFMGRYKSQNCLRNLNSIMLWYDSFLFLYTHTTKSNLMTIEINIRNKEIFASNFFANQNTTTLIILILKVSLILKSYGKRLNLISVIKD